MNVSFTEKQREYIAEQVKGGNYQNASEVVRDALRLHQVYRQKVLETLCSEIDEGWEGPTSQGKVQDIIDAKTKGR